MKKDTALLLPLVAFMFLLSGCQLLEGVLKLGFWSGAILVVILIGVIWLVARAFQR